VGRITYWDPFSQRNAVFDAPGGGRGYYRPASLMGIWATAPFLHDNSVGLFNNDPSVRGRMEAFSDAITRLLTLGRTEDEEAETRWRMGPPGDGGHSVNLATADRYVRDHGLIWRTPVETYLRIPARSEEGLIAGLFPQPLSWLIQHLWAPPCALLLAAAGLLLGGGRSRGRRRLGRVFLALAVAGALFTAWVRDRLTDLNAGPIPAGTPVNLLANINPGADGAPASIAEALRLFHERGAAASEAERRRLDGEIAARLFAISNSPDLVVDRGHYFTRDLTPRELGDLVELLKTF